MAKKKRRNKYEMSYYEKITSFYNEMKYSIDKKPLLILLCLSGISTLAYGIIYTFIDNSSAEWLKILLYALTTYWGASLICGLLYTTFAIFKAAYKRSKLFALYITTTFSSLFILWNIVGIAWATEELSYFVEWIPVLILIALYIGWFIRTVIQIRKDMHKEYVESNGVPFGAILWLLGSAAPISTFSGRKNIGSWLPDNIVIYYMSYLMFMINAFATRFILDMIMYCKITLFGRKKMK